MGVQTASTRGSAAALTAISGPMPAGSPTVMAMRGCAGSAMMAAGAAAALRAAVAAPGRVRTAAVIRAPGVLHALAVGKLIAQAAFQAAALPRQLGRIQTEVLLL